MGQELSTSGAEDSPVRRPTSAASPESASLDGIVTVVRRDKARDAQVDPEVERLSAIEKFEPIVPATVSTAFTLQNIFPSAKDDRYFDARVLRDVLETYTMLQLHMKRSAVAISAKQKNLQSNLAEITEQCRAIDIDISRKARKMQKFSTDLKSVHTIRKNLNHTHHLIQDIFTILEDLESCLPSDTPRPSIEKDYPLLSILQSHRRSSKELKIKDISAPFFLKAGPSRQSSSVSLSVDPVFSDKHQTTVMSDNESINSDQSMRQPVPQLRLHGTPNINRVSVSSAESASASPTLMLATDQLKRLAEKDSGGRSTNTSGVSLSLSETMQQAYFQPDVE